MITNEAYISKVWQICVPFLRWDNLYNPRLHAIVIDLVNKLLEVAELIHGLKTPLILSVSYHMAG